jgi:2-dehydro-3-deoxygluconokinase
MSRAQEESSTGGFWRPGDRTTGHARTALEGHRIETVDTVGADAAFVAGYLAGRIGGETPVDALRLANACGALTCMVVGDWEGAPTRDDLGLLAGGEPVLR